MARDRRRPATSATIRMTGCPTRIATMQMHARSPTAEPPAPSRRRWLRRVLWLGLVAVLAGAALTGWLAYRFGGQLETVFAETDRLDPHWRLDDLEAHRPAVPDAENGALKVSALRATSPARFLPGELPAERQLNAVQIEALDATLQTAGPARLAGMRALADFPHGRTAIPYAPDWFSTLLPHVQGHREVGLILRHDALARSQTGDADGAALDALAALNAGSSIGDEPLVVSQFVRIACQTNAVDDLERVLAQGEPSPDRLAVLQRR